MKYMITTLVLMIACLASATTAQERDAIEMARDFPPEMLKDNLAVVQINWKLKQLEKNQSEHNKSLALLAEQLDIQRRHIQAITEKLPIEIRFANEDVRADLIGACLRELLSTRLEVASNHETIAQLTRELEQAKLEDLEIDRLNKEKLELKMRSVETRLKMARQAYEHDEALFKKSFKTKQEVERSKYSLQIAQYELAQAKLSIDIQGASRANEIAQRLIEARIDIQPLVARAAAAEAFLQLFSKSDELIAEIARLNWYRESNFEDVQESLRRIRKLKSQISELQTFRDLIQSTAAEAKEKTEQNKDEEKE